MSSNIFKKIKNIRDLGNLKLDQRIIVFLFFVLLSTIFWFLNALNREYITDISYPVRYINFPGDKVLVNDLPPDLDLQVKSHGYNLIKYKINSGLLPIVFDVKSSFLMEDNEQDNRYYILTRMVRDKISSQISSEIQVLDIKPDSLVFVLSDIVKKMVKIKPVADLQLQQQYMIKGGIKTSPDSLKVKGPANVLDTLQYLPTETIELKSVNQTVEETVYLEIPKGLIVARKKVKVTIPVEQFTEANLNIPVRVKNLPDTVELKTFPEMVAVSFMVGLSDYNKIDKDMFEAVVDYEAVQPGTDRLEVKIEEAPGFIKSLNYFPNSVEYILER